jgi:leucyl aminopeptidase (aminopeptidase T)
MTAVDHQARQAARTIVQRIGHPKSQTVHVLFTPDKENLAAILIEELRQHGLAGQSMRVSGTAGLDTTAVAEILRCADGHAGYIVLLSYQYAGAVFTGLGRPDRGLKKHGKHLFCDWFIPTPALIRTHAIDVEEHDAFRRKLLRAVSGASCVQITTRRGTDLMVLPRRWNQDWGEMFTAPIEGLAEGTVVVDGAVYGGPAKTPFTLRLKAGRIANLAQLDREDEQQRTLHSDLTRDSQASVLAELGLGINTGADRGGSIMEAEQARGTCHVGFGHNLAYGGQNASAFHGDVVLMQPSIVADGRVICRDGVYEL